MGGPQGPHGMPMGPWDPMGPRVQGPPNGSKGILWEGPHGALGNPLGSRISNGGRLYLSMQAACTTCRCLILFATDKRFHEQSSTHNLAASPIPTHSWWQARRSMVNRYCLSVACLAPRSASPRRHEHRRNHHKDLCKT